MRNDRRFSVAMVLGLFFFAIGCHPAGAQNSLQALEGAQGGKIVYGPMDGASTEAQAMSKVLRLLHNNCGERPQVGQSLQTARHELRRGLFYRGQPPARKQAEGRNDHCLSHRP